MIHAQHLVLDLETLGIRPGSAVVAIGARIFNANGPGPGFEAYINVASAKDYGRADQSTLDWWAKQDPDVRTRVMGGHLTTDVALHAFSQFVAEHRPEYVWANSPSFDCVLLKETYTKIGIEWPIDFRSERDSRTIRWIAKQFGLDLHDCYTEMKPHQPLDDATADAKAIIKTLRFLEQLRVDADKPPVEVFTHPDAPKQVSTLGALGGPDL